MKDKYFTILRDSFPKPPTQTAVGRVPVEYLKAVNGGDHSTRLLSLLDGQFRPLRRSRVHEICRDENIPVLEAYAVAMAWGGQHPVHFSSSIEEPSRSRLERMLHELRNSRNHREKDFEVVQSACTRIRGLGISFFSKLLFFFRPDPDAFILDQWTAKSMNLLFEDPPVSVSRFGFPAPDTSPIQYDLFCRSVEKVAAQLGWTGEEAEMGMFDKPRGRWRLTVKQVFPPTGIAKSKFPPPPPPPPPNTVLTLGAGGHGDGLVKLICKYHDKALSDGRDLPGEETASRHRSTPRIVCSGKDGVSWQYHVQKSFVRVDLFFSGTQVQSYEKLREYFGCEAHDFGDEMVGNGDCTANLTRSISTRTQRGSGAEETEYNSIANDAVGLMEALYQKFGPFL